MTNLSDRPLIYAGIGARKTPADVLRLMTQAARALSGKGYVLRSGHADGADLAFEAGAPDDRKEIYLPWAGFNGSTSPLHHLSADAIALAARYHPGWDTLSPAARKLMARNGYQVLGQDLNDPVRFVLCWTPDGCIHAADRSPRTGGTGQAIAIADACGIPVYNLKREDHRRRIEAMIAATDVTLDR